MSNWLLDKGLCAEPSGSFDSVWKMVLGQEKESLRDLLRDALNVLAPQTARIGRADESIHMCIDHAVVGLSLVEVHQATNRSNRSDWELRALRALDPHLLNAV